MLSAKKNKESNFASIYNFLAAIVIAFVCLAAFRNTLTWHLQAFWGKSGDFWQQLWNKFLDFSGDDEYVFYVWWTFMFTFLVYWVFGLIYVVLDVTNKPKILRKYKIQPNTNEPIETKKLIKVILHVIFVNQILVGIPFGILAYHASKWRGIQDLRQLPSFHSVLLEIVACILIEEFGFYYSHRAMHHKLIYKHIHKQHHEFTSPIAITAIYAHPIEHIFSNILPPFLGVFICGSHIVTSWIWFAMALTSTLNAHSGYHFPFFPSPEAHDFHHLKFNYNFGVLGFLDRFHKTDKLFRESPQGKRHLMLLSFQPAYKQFPDTREKSS